jgi:carbon dioxide concentrating mechanism protein CcmN
MHLPPLQSPSTPGFYVSGDVAIAEDAVIAPGVVLRADPGCSIVVGSGVLIGLGAVIHAVGGAIALEANANLGAGVLMVGRCRVGTSACVGASTTLHNADVAPGQLVMPGSLLGGTQVAQTQQASVAAQAYTSRASGSQASASQSFMSPTPSPWDDEPDAAGSQQANQSQANQSQANQSQANQSQAKRPEPDVPKVVYGKEQFNQIRMMFSKGSPTGSNGSTA